MREIWLTDGPVRLFAVEHGEGPAVVLLHGGLTNHQSVWPFVEPLLDRYRVVTPDLRGSGRSWSSESLTFDRLADDLERLLDHLAIEEAFIGGISSGSGPAVRFALKHAGRTRGLIVVTPVYGGRKFGYTPSQAAAFAAMDAVAGRAGAEGIEVLRPMFLERLPSGVGQRAWEIAKEFDAASVVATSRFIASGAQPFGSSHELSSVAAPTLLLPGNDDTHPAEISDLYAASIPDCTVFSGGGSETMRAIRHFCDAVIAA